MFLLLSFYEIPYRSWKAQEHSENMPPDFMGTTNWDLHFPCSPRTTCSTLQGPPLWRAHHVQNFTTESPPCAKFSQPMPSLLASVSPADCLLRYGPLLPLHILSPSIAPGAKTLREAALTRLMLWSLVQAWNPFQASGPGPSHRPSAVLWQVYK